MEGQLREHMCSQILKFPSLIDLPETRQDTRPRGNRAVTARKYSGSRGTFSDVYFRLLSPSGFELPGIRG